MNQKTKQILKEWAVPLSVIFVAILLISFCSSCVTAMAGETRAKDAPSQEIDAPAMLKAVNADIKEAQTALRETEQYKAYSKENATLEKKILEEVPEYQRLIQLLNKREAIKWHQKIKNAERKIKNAERKSLKALKDLK